MPSKPTRARVAPKIRSSAPLATIVSPATSGHDQAGPTTATVRYEDIADTLRRMALDHEDPDMRVFAEATGKMLVRLWTLVDETKFHLAIASKREKPDLSPTLEMLRRPLDIEITVPARGGEKYDGSK